MFIPFCCVLFGLGWISSYYNKLFMAIIFGLPPALGLGIKLSTPFLTTADLTFSEMFAALPADLQNFIIIAPFAILGGRLLGWIYQVYFQKEKVEDRDKRRKRILEQHGMEDILSRAAPAKNPLPSLRAPSQTASQPAYQPRQALSVNKSKRATSFGKRR